MHQKPCNPFQIRHHKLRKAARAGVVKLVDALDSKSCSARSVGSSPTTGTIWKMQLTLSPRGEIKSNLHHLVYLGK